MEATIAILRIDKDFKMPTRSKVYARKPNPIRAILMDVEFEIKNSKGSVYGLPGDYLIQDFKGEYHVMSSEIFKNNYEEIRIGN